MSKGIPAGGFSPKKRSQLVSSKAFMITEGTSYGLGGFGGYMNLLIADCEQELDEKGARRPFKIEFGGGDGVMSPCYVYVKEKP